MAIETPMGNVGISEEDQDMMEGMYLTFMLTDQSYGIEIRHVIEIIRMQQVTEVPDVADYIKGVINLRGKVIPVMDVRRRFGLDSQNYNERTCIIVVSINDAETGMIVDTMKDVVDIPDEKIQEPPTVGSGNDKRFIQGLGKVDHDIHILLDIESVIGSLEEAF